MERRERGHVRKHLAAALLVAMVSGISAPAAAHTLENENQQRSHIEERARTQIGAPYSSGGSSPSGFDCSGFTRWVFEGHGANLPHSSAEQFEMGERDGYRRIWKREDLKVGDLVFHKTTSARVGHVGIYVGDGKFISSTSSSGVQVNSLYDPHYWGSRWVGATRLPVTMDDPSDGQGRTAPVWPPLTRSQKG